MSHLSSTAQTILIVLVVFIVAINLSLVFAFRNRFRDAPRNRERGTHARRPWESKDAGQADELHHKLEEIRKDQDGPGGM